MELYHSFHLPHFHLARAGPLLMYAALRRLAIAMVSVFSPIYVYQVFLQHGFSTRTALVAAFLNVAILFLSKAVFIPLALKQACGRGLRWVLIVSTIPMIFFLIALVGLKTVPLILVFASALWGISAAYFWAGFHSFFVYLGDSDHFGEEVGLSQVLDLSAGFLAPLFGGVIIQIFGFFWFFGAALLLIISSLIPLVRVDHQKCLSSFSFQHTFESMLDHPRAILAYFGIAGTDVLNLTAWPLYVFFLYGSIFELGLVTAAAVFIAGSVTVVIGFLANRGSRVKLIHLGAVGQSVSWIMKMLVRSVPAVIGADTLYRIFERTVHVPLDVYTYQKARDSNPGQAVFFREVTLALSAVAILLLSSLLIWFGASLTTLFALGALVSAGSLLLRN